MLENQGVWYQECEKTSSKKMDTSDTFNDEDCTDGPSVNDFSSEDEDYEELTATQRGKKLAKHIGSEMALIRWPNDCLKYHPVF